MTGVDDPGADQEARVAEASDWFAKMKGPHGRRGQAEFERWMQNSDNAAAYRQIEAVWLLSGRASPRSRPPSSREARQWWRLAAVAAAVAGGVTLAALLDLDSAREGTYDSVSYAAPLGTIREVRLGDGSVVTLDTDSRIAVRLEGDRREVDLLAGRARFAVAHDPSRPFVVFASERAVVATGTVFDVQIKLSHVEVTLIEGGVDIERVGDDHRFQRLGRLRPGERASLDTEVNISVARSQPSVTAWTSGLFTAENLLLRELVAEANRYSIHRIALAEPSLGALRVSGAFKLSSPDALSAQLAAALDLQVTHVTDGTIMLSRGEGIGPPS